MQERYYTYILESETTGRLYVGHTSDLEARLLRHNEGQTLRRDILKWPLAHRYLTCGTGIWGLPSDIPADRPAHHFGLP
ncbi:MAG: GIY-YIG nuclease family protein [Calditrichaeota bacterium]|nr:GIY-YIG nuclease family protein [Calditrichota bacterium]